MKRAHGNGKTWARGVFGLVLAGWLGLAAGADAGRIVLAAGEARMDGQIVKEGEAVPEGAELSTGADGYLYLKTVDNGFLILRPGSVATIEAYHVDTDDPKKSRFKLSLRQGVARSVSGEAVGKAKENFRFNTPVAAIGVRGTDFSIYADAEETRLVVFSGGVIVSGFDAACQPGGDGPCEGAGSREFFAGTLGVLQILKEENIPRIIEDKSLSPDFVTPPRKDEPAVPGSERAAKESSGAAGTASGTLSAGQDTASADNPAGQGAEGAALTGPGDLAAGPSPKQDAAGQETAGPDSLKQITVDQEVADLDPLKQSQLQPIIWGRWQSISDDLPATVDLGELENDKEHYVMISNEHYIIWRNKENVVLTPASGGLSFTLAGSQAHVQGAFGQASASVTDGNLSFDFDRARFSTQINLNAQGQDYALHANGSVTSNGVFQSSPQLSGNMETQGFLSKAQQEMNASYIFQSTLSDGLKASGVTFWNKPVAH
jgi:hypothetical protein